MKMEEIVFPNNEGAPSFNIPVHFTQPPIIRDDLVTKTSTEQDETIAECLPYLLGIEDPTRNPFDFNEYGVPMLEKVGHIRFLEGGLEGYPPKFVSADASRPWMVYWSLNGLSLLGKDVSRYRHAVVRTFTAAQSPTGGIGGGHGHQPHLAPSYAAIESIALVGGHDTYSLIDREAMWRWLGRLKQCDGGFQMCEGGEIDTRGAYSAMVLIVLLNLPLTLPHDCEAREKGGLESFTDGLAEWISRSQTFQGGIADNPGTEAHAAYTFLGIACLCLLGPPHIMLPRYLDMPNLISWLSNNQHAPEGGFAGRANKLVDGCYSHWAAGGFPLIQAALQGPLTDEEASKTRPVDLYNREGLVRYTLSCCQQKYGGLRDKPSAPADCYHTNYALSGLSQTQHFCYYNPTPTPVSTTTLSSPTHSTLASTSTFLWRSIPMRSLSTPESEREDRIIWDESDEIAPLHPIFVMSHKAVREIREWSLGQAGEEWV